jgi:pyruvate kinase
LRKGDCVRLADGAIELAVAGCDGGGVDCRVAQGGLIRSRQGLHIPNARGGRSVLTPKDRRDLALGLQLGVDAVALSFVREAADVLALRELLPTRGPRPLIIAKIERGQALADIDAIVEAADGVMVARGDLGIEIGVEKVPLAQQRIIAAARRRHKPVIIATQMLESMIEHSVPTRAEVSDVAHAVLEGADALMLSAETAIGAFPVESVQVLDRVARQVEEEGQLATLELLPTEVEDVPLAMARAARIAARAVRAAAVAGLHRLRAHRAPREQPAPAPQDLRPDLPARDLAPHGLLLGHHPAARAARPRQRRDDRRRRAHAPAPPPGPPRRVDRDRGR